AFGCGSEPSSGELFSPSPQTGASGERTDGTSTTGGGADSALPVPGGSFALGRSASGADACPVDQECHPSELPEHPVDVSSFWLDATEVSVVMFRDWVSAYGSEPPAISPGVGRLTSLPGSGWRAEYTAILPSDRAALVVALACHPDATYSEQPGPNDP